MRLGSTSLVRIEDEKSGRPTGNLRHHPAQGRPEDESEKEYADANGLLWDCFVGGKKSKVYGIYTHCQYDMDRIMDITHSDRVLLLQIGEDFTDEGIFSVLIPREDLRRRRFDDCEFEWGQS